MFKNLKLKSIQKQLDKNIRARDNSQVHSELVTVGFVYNSDSKKDIETLYSIASSLGIDRANCKLLAFQKHEKNKELLSHQITDKQIKWKGVIENNEANTFLQTPLDLLVGVYTGLHPYLDFLVSQSKARFKVGLKSSDLRLFDLQIDVAEDNTAVIIEELKKYLQVLGKVN